jgi:hypothetical protein
MFYGERNGGIRTYLEAKAAYAARTSRFEHHLVIPGKATASDGEGRHEHRSLRVAASNGYRVPLGGSELQAHRPPPPSRRRCSRSPGSWSPRPLPTCPSSSPMGCPSSACTTTGWPTSATSTATGCSPSFATLLVDLLAECGIDGSEPSGRARMMQR